jgi:hypothetical protein
MLPRQSEWEATVSQCQKSSESSSAKDKWKLVERIYKLDQRRSAKLKKAIWKKCRCDIINSEYGMRSALGLIAVPFAFVGCAADLEDGCIGVRC